MPTYRLTIEYDGTDFHGWQVQPDARTVAGTLLEAVKTLTGEAVSLTAAGRTDSGAHAHGQVAGLTLEQQWDPPRLLSGLNAHLSADVVVVDAELRASGFHARRDAVSRTYRYFVVSRAHRAAVTRTHAWTVRGPLDLEAMRAAAAELTGTHDFAAFGRSPAPGGSTVRAVHEVSVESVTLGGQGATSIEGLVITVRANAFLRGMMRAFAAVLVGVGQGRRAPQWAHELVHAPAGNAPPLQPAPAHGLHQWAVEYPWETLAARGVAA
jgi:tRNA pseudouridine38-40 synthase